MRTRNILIALFTAGSLLVGTGVAFAGGPNQKGPNVEKRVEKMTKKLELDEAQAAKIKSILESSRADMKDLRDADGDRATKKEQFKLIRQSTRAEIDAVLTPAQLEKAEEFRAQMKDKRKGKRKQMRRGKGKHLAKKLDLSQDQEVKVREITKTARADMRTIVEEDFGGDRKAAKSAVQERRAKMVADIKAELTPEQAEKFATFEDKMKEHKGKRGHRKGNRGKGANK